MTEICERNHPGWAIPVCSTFWYNVRQKQLLYKYFIEGEETGKKMSPQQVEQSLHSKLTVEEYVTVRQTKSLYSRLSKMLSEGKLTSPVNNIDEVEDIAEDSIDNDQAQLEQQKTILDVLEDVMNDLTYAVDDYVAIAYSNKWYLGKVTEVIKIA